MKQFDNLHRIERVFYLLNQIFYLNYECKQLAKSERKLLNHIFSIKNWWISSNCHLFVGFNRISFFKLGRY